MATVNLIGNIKVASGWKNFCIFLENMKGWTIQVKEMTNEKKDAINFFIFWNHLKKSHVKDF